MVTFARTGLKEQECKSNQVITCIYIYIYSYSLTTEGNWLITKSRFIQSFLGCFIEALSPYYTEVKIIKLAKLSFWVLNYQVMEAYNNEDKGVKLGQLI